MISDGATQQDTKSWVALSDQEDPVVDESGSLDQELTAPSLQTWRDSPYLKLWCYMVPLAATSLVFVFQVHMQYP